MACLSVLLLCASIVNAYWDVVKAIPAEVYGAMVYGGFLLLTAYLAYEFGLKTHFRQREHEVILKRYLTEGIDRLLELVDSAGRTFLDNHSKVSTIVLRLQARLDIDLSVKFRRVQTFPDFTPLFKLRCLLGDETLAYYIQDLYIFVNSMAAYLDKDFLSLLSRATDELRSQQDPETSEKMAKEFTQVLQHQLDEYVEDFKKYGRPIGVLMGIAHVLEREGSLSWANLGEFKNRSDIKWINEKIRSEFAEIRKRREARLGRKQT